MKIHHTLLLILTIPSCLSSHIISNLQIVTSFNSQQNSGNRNQNQEQSSSSIKNENQNQCLIKCPQLGQICVKSGKDKIICKTICGDGLVAGNEECDDQNQIYRDGCSNCLIQKGWSCQNISGEPSKCSTICGDRILTGNQKCDDGNSLASDGCSNCQIEKGWICQSKGGITTSYCTSICGDGIVVGSEQCDDGNTYNRDGCSNCLTKKGWICQNVVGKPSTCSIFCGDGIVLGNQQCDDGNTINNDGCSNCSIEKGWNCQTKKGSPTQCVSICGDGLQVGNEQCDDGNTISGDGCSKCLIEQGWSCQNIVGQISHCSIICGDELLLGNEQCDDGNSVSGDGCSKCLIEKGWKCQNNVGKPSVCVTVCGDGLQAGNEQCDDGNTINNDGCSNCSIDQGWSCQIEINSSSSVCTKNCGNLKLDINEQCQYTLIVGCNLNCKFDSSILSPCFSYVKQIENNPPPYFSAQANQTFICGLHKDLPMSYGCVNCIYIQKNFICGIQESTNTYQCGLPCPASSQLKSLTVVYPFLVTFGALQAVAQKYFNVDFIDAMIDLLTIQQYIQFLKVNSMYNIFVVYLKQQNYTEQINSKIVAEFLFENFHLPFINNLKINQNDMNILTLYYPDNPNNPSTYWYYVDLYLKNKQYLTDSFISDKPQALQAITQALTCIQLEFIIVDPSTIE